MPKAKPPLSTTFGERKALYVSTKMVALTEAVPDADKTGVNYRVIYADGYTSECPAKVFERDYASHTQMPFEAAFFCVRKGGVVFSKSLGIELWAVIRKGKVPKPVLLHNVKNAIGNNQHSLLDVVTIPASWVLASDWALIAAADGRVFDPLSTPLF